MNTKNLYLTDETFTYVINGADRDYNLSVPTGDDLHKNILLSEDFGIYMNERLDASVEEYYCEVIQYVYNNYNDGGVTTETTTNVNFTQLYSDLVEYGEKPNIITDKARYPLTQFASTKNNTGSNSIYNGITRNNVLQLQKTTFVCKNFNRQVKYFRLASLRYDSEYGFIPVSSFAPWGAFGDTSLLYPYTGYLPPQDGATGGLWEQQYWLKNYPHVIMYMTPIYKEKIPRLLKEDDAITLVINSKQRISGTYGDNCVVRINPINSKYKKFKAVFQSLDLLGTLNVSQYTRTLCNFAFHFVCYDWDKSAYGYGGGEQYNNCHILTTLPITFNYQNSSKVAKLASTNGSIITINNELHNKDIRFQFLMSQMRPPVSVNMGGLNTAGFLSASNPEWEWMLTMRLYGIE